MKEKVPLGADLKLNIHIEPINGYSMADYDFEVKLFSSQFRSITMKKEQLIAVDNDNYLACFSTLDVGSGELKALILAKIPDEDFEKGYRNEPIDIDTDIDIYRV